MSIKFPILRRLYAIVLIKKKAWPLFNQHPCYLFFDHGGDKLVSYAANRINLYGLLIHFQFLAQGAHMDIHRALSRRYNRSPKRYS